jgi:hypothetical protein
MTDCELNDFIVIRGWLRILCLLLMQPHKGKGKGHPRTGHKFPGGE